MAILGTQTGSILENADGSNRTGTGISTNIVIKVNNQTVGAIQNLSIREERQIQMIDEVGTDGHIDSVPIRSTNISGECRRIRFDRLRITEAFSRGFLHVHAQRIPFDIVIIDKWKGDGSSAIITTVKNVWIGNLNVDYTADNWVITDSMSWQAEAIFSTLNGSNAAQGGERKLIRQTDSIELLADRGAKRGALDEAGLLDAVFTEIA